MADRALTGVLLVGGASARFGSPKALAASTARRSPSSAGRRSRACDERIAVGKAADGLELRSPCSTTAATSRAAIAGVVAGLRAAAHEVAVVLPVDTPLVTTASLRALADACRDAAVPQTGPLPGAYRKTALPALESGELSLRRAIAALDVAHLDLDPAELVNINTQDELELLQRR